MQLSKNVELRSAKNQVDVLIIDNDFSEAQISLYGGHVLSFAPKSDNRERLWVSECAVLDGTKAIRGGVPICWPWFGEHVSNGHPSVKRQAHGYVRTQQWQVVECVDSDIGTVVTLKPEAAVNPGFDSLGEGEAEGEAEGEGNVDLQLTVSIGNVLAVELTTKNVGATPFEFGGALHSYFNIEDISQTQLHGLSGDYLDKAPSFIDKSSVGASSGLQVTPETYIFEKETDNIHLSVERRLSIRAANFSIDVESQGHDSIVVWNPWIEKSAAMADMQDDGYQSMLCVEAAITQGVTLAPNEQHTLTQIIR